MQELYILLDLLLNKSQKSNALLAEHIKFVNFIIEL